VGVDLIHHFPASRFHNQTIAGYWPMKDETNVRPLLETLHNQGRILCLPCTPPKGKPLVFRRWQHGDTLVEGRFGTKEPAPTKTVIDPDIILVPLLAFSPKGDRLGYGGGYYDRTLATLRARKKVFACGVANAGQEMADIPTSTHDERLDGILTGQGFRVFA